MYNAGSIGAWERGAVSATKAFRNRFSYKPVTTKSHDENVDVMSDRILRDELLTSPRYWAVSIEAQRLFVHLILVVDDCARFSGKPYTICTSCFPGHPIGTEKIDRLLFELVDQDLLRMYYVDDERFIYMPRFRQRTRYTNSKFPAPPKEIIEMRPRKSDLSPTQVWPKSDSSQHEVAVAVAVPVSDLVLPSEVRVKTQKARSDVPYQQIIDLYHEILPELSRVAKLTATRRSHIRARWEGKDAEDLADWRAYFERVHSSRFLLGLVPPAPGRSKAFKASLDWLINEANFMKVLEGTYDK